MQKVYYIGSNTEFFTSLVMKEEFIAKTSKSVMGLLNSRFKPSVVIIDHEPMATNLQSVIGTLRKQGYDVPIYVLAKDLHKHEKAMLLKLGVSEIITNVSEFEKFLSFKKELLKSGLNSPREKVEFSYRIPLWKRAFDIAFSLSVLLVISPILLFVAIAIYIESPGPVLYRSKRVGTGYDVFDFLKFRSMYVNADRKLAEMKKLNQYESEEVKGPQVEAGTSASNEILIGDNGEMLSEAEWMKIKAENATPTFLKIKDDPRITKVGRIIRSTSIDELPQFINVLKGDMSVVGNRPLPLYEAVELTTDQWAARFLAPAGITGLWQVEKRGKGEMSETERKQLDIKYALNVGLRMDLNIILRTFPALLQKENV